MGDLCDQNDLDRFLRSPEGQEHLESLGRTLSKRRIVHVEFTNEIHAIAVTLHLDNGKTLDLYHPSLEVEAIREEFRDVLQREFDRDYPERIQNEYSS